MSRTYSIERTPGGYYRIISNGKPLRWLYARREFAEMALQDIQERAELRRKRAAHRKAMGRAPVRDSKRKAAYSAERSALVVGNPAFRLSDRWTDDALSELCAGWAFQAGLKPIRPRVRTSNRKGRGRAHASVTEIVMAPGLCVGVLAHEYAHVLTWEEKPDHGPRWANTYVRLVRVAMGASFADELARRFRAIGFPIDEAQAQAA